MKKKSKKLYLQQEKRYLKKVVGSLEKPRLSVFRSHNHIYGQLIDDTTGKTLAASSTLTKGLFDENTSKATKDAAFKVGEDLAVKALEKNISFVVFDRGNRPYHGRIEQLAEGARSKGLIF